MCQHLNKLEFHSQTNRHIALFRKGKDLTSKDRGFRYGEYYKSHTHRGFRDLGIKGFREPEDFFGILRVLKDLRDFMEYFKSF